jgi:hypothetical protein
MGARWARWGLVLVLASSLAPAQPSARFAAPGNGTRTLSPGFIPDPMQVSGTARGAVDASTLAPTCSGFVGAAPDLALVLRGNEPWLRVYVSSPLDTTLVVRRPDGSFLCDDDTYGRHPSVEGAFPPGRYLVWVGTYHAGQTATYTLSVTEVRSNHP